MHDREPYFDITVSPWYNVSIEDLLYHATNIAESVWH